MTFAEYLADALRSALEDDATGADRHNLQNINTLCRAGVKANWTALTGDAFLWNYFYVIGMSGRRWDVRTKFLEGQEALLRGLKVSAVVAEADCIRREWSPKRLGLTERMLEGVIAVATAIEKSRWEGFRSAWLLLPAAPETANPEEWGAARRQLRKLQMVGDANAWYLVRNLYGGPYFKPDVHVQAIARHFFGPDADANVELAAGVRAAWAQTCHDPRLLPVHIGEVDYVLWWHRRKKLARDETLQTRGGDCSQAGDD